MRRRVVLLRFAAGALVLAAGCMRWSGVEVGAVPPWPSTLRLHLQDGTSVVVRNAVIRDDSIIGVPWGSAPAGSRVAIARSRVERIDFGEKDEVKTFGLVLGIVVVVLGALVWIAAHLYDNEAT